VAAAGRRAHAKPTQNTHTSTCALQQPRRRAHLHAQQPQRWQLLERGDARRAAQSCCLHAEQLQRRQARELPNGHQRLAADAAAAHVDAQVLQRAARCGRVQVLELQRGAKVEVQPLQLAQLLQAHSQLKQQLALQSGDWWLAQGCAQRADEVSRMQVQAGHARSARTPTPPSHQPTCARARLQRQRCEGAERPQARKALQRRKP
jgi:hypothetical protein